MVTMKNPFVLGGYVSSEYFCDRENESSELISSFSNERNTILISPRRMGKTGLIQHCFHQKEVQKEYYTFFIDIYATGTVKELVFALGKEIFTALKPRGKKFIEQFFAIITSLRPAFKLDRATGEPVFDLGIGEIMQPLLSLEEIFIYLEHVDRRCIVAIDEFQQIAKYPEKHVEAILRTHIQQCKNTTFIYSGSERHMMENMFFTPSRPFYQSASVLNLDAISLAAYSEFIQKHFKRGERKISSDAIESIYALFEGHTWYVQSLLNRLYEEVDPGEEVTPFLINDVLHRMISANKTVYQSMVSMLSERQKELLFAVAKSGKVSEITSTLFVRKHGLYSTSSVQSSAKQLLEKELLTKSGNQYWVYDRFFGLWLAETYGTGYSI
ncbi:MAG: AAA family ATPase [Phocaeicola sp.]